MGFFNDNQLAAMVPAGCGHTCRLNKTCDVSRLAAVGGGRKGILIIGETPSPAGTHYSSEAGAYLRAALAKAGVNMVSDCWVTSAVTCPTPAGRAPTQLEITACRPYLLKLIAELSPRLILMLGPAAVAAVVGHSNPKMAFGKKRGYSLLCGKLFPDAAFPQAWLGVTMSPAHVLKTKFDTVIPVLWEKDIKGFIEDAENAHPEPFNVEADTAACEIISSPDRALQVLGKAHERQALMAFDYETTGLKPHAAGHRVVSIGFCPSYSRAFSFGLPETVKGTGWDDVKAKWRDIMGDKAMPKVAHNVAFEWEWTRWCFKVVPVGWAGDTQVLAHLEDSRPGHSGLKAQAYLKFGVAEYTSAVDAYKGASSEATDAAGCNAFNRMGVAPLRDMLLYNAKDALYCFRLFKWYAERGLVAPDGQDYMVYG